MLVVDCRCPGCEVGPACCLDPLPGLGTAICGTDPLVTGEGSSDGLLANGTNGVIAASRSVGCSFTWATDLNAVI